MLFVVGILRFLFYFFIRYYVSKQVSKYLYIATKYEIKCCRKKISKTSKINNYNNQPE